MAPKRTIALTFDLKSYYAGPGVTDSDLAEFDTEEAIDAITTTIQGLGYDIVLVGNYTRLVHALAKEEHQQWDLVFNIAEGIRGSSREAQIPGLLEAYGIPFVFSNSRTLTLVHDKALTKTILQREKIPTATFITWSHTETFVPLSKKEWMEKMGLDTAADFPSSFVKPNQEGSSKGIGNFSRVDTVDALNETVSKLRTEFQDQDVLIETFLDGREFTVGIVGSGESARVLCVMEYAQLAEIDTPFMTPANKLTHQGGESCQGHWKPRIVRGADDPEVAIVEDVALRAWRALDCFDGGRVDVRSKGHGIDAKPQVMEINALIGLNPKTSALPQAAEMVGYDHSDLLRMFIDSAWRRSDRSSQQGLNGSK